MNIDKIKDRIRKLFNLAADDAAAEGEIATALKAARELMLAHQLSDDDVAATPEQLQTPEEVAEATEYGTAKSWSNTGKAPNWQGSLAMAVAEFLGTVNCYRDRPLMRRNSVGMALNGGNPVVGWVFYGPADDVQLATELHNELLLTCAAMGMLKFGGKCMSGPSRDYCDGFATGLREKVKESQQQVASESPKLLPDATILGQSCKVLAVVRATDIAAAKRSYAKHWLHATKGVKLTNRSGRGRSVSDAGAYNEGKTDGGNQSLVKQRVGRITN